MPQNLEAVPGKTNPDLWLANYLEHRGYMIFPFPVGPSRFQTKYAPVPFDVGYIPDTTYNHKRKAKVLRDSLGVLHSRSPVIKLRFQHPRKQKKKKRAEGDSKTHSGSRIINTGLLCF